MYMHLSKSFFTRFMTIDELIDQLSMSRIVNKTFATMPDFKEWKEGYETASFSLFVLQNEWVMCATVITVTGQVNTLQGVQGNED